MKESVVNSISQDGSSQVNDVLFLWEVCGGSFTLHSLLVNFILTG